jgi:hypothetical protein
MGEQQGFWDDNDAVQIHPVVQFAFDDFKHDSSRLAPKEPCVHHGCL